MATLGDYMNWLRSIGGKCQSGIQADHEIGMVPVTKMISAVGRYVIHDGGDQSEQLSPELVEFYDRRLMVISPFQFKIRH